MMYLTRIVVDGREAIHHRLVDGYAWHQALWLAYPNRPVDKRDFQYRVDVAPDTFRVLLLSPHAPQPLPWGEWTTKAVADGFLDHPRYAFELRANPTMRRSVDGRRLGITQEDRLREWLHRQAGRAGFRVADEVLLIGAPVEDTFHKPARNGARGLRGKHLRVDFSGVLDVIDATAFRAAFACGIGTARAFGFGMLTLQPLA